MISIKVVNNFAIENEELKMNSAQINKGKVYTCPTMVYRYANSVNLFCIMIAP